MHRFRFNIDKLLTRRNIFILLAGLFILSVLPIVIISFYSIPSADDYNTSANLGYAYRHDHNIINVLSEIFSLSRAVDLYNNLQGSFGNSVISAFCPLIFGDNNYAFTPLFLLFSFLTCMWAICKVLLCKILRYDAYNALIILMCIVVACLQLMPSPVEGFFWWSGGVLYTFFFSLGLLLIALALVLTQHLNRFVSIGLTLVGSILALFIGGGGLPSAIFVTLIMASICLWVLFMPKAKRISLFIVTAFCAIGLILSASAPGNTARLVRETVSYNPEGLGRTIMLCFRLGHDFLRNWLSIPLILILILSTPFCYYGLNQCKYKFRYPIAFISLTYCLYCAMFAPSAYSYGWIGPPRYMNVVYFGFVFMLFADLLYCLGWIRYRLQVGLTARGFDESQITVAVFSHLRRYTLGFLLCLSLMLYPAFSPSFYNQKSRQPFFSESAFFSLIDGSAKQFHAEYMDRVRLFRDPEATVVAIKPFTVKPHVLYFSDIFEHPEWFLQPAKTLYGKENILLLPDRTP